ncbi:MAG: hypothetical protein AAGD34_11790, partial [Pseudomonadota bacterium]
IVSCFAVFAFAAPPASAQTRSDWLVGTWVCKSTLRGVGYTMTWRYRSNGRFSMDYSSSGVRRGVRLASNGFGTGRWALGRNGQARRQYNSFVIERMTVNGRPARPRIYARATREMKNGVVRTRIVRQSRNAFRERPSRGGRAWRCRRR